MCLILFAIRQHPTHALVVAANRDESHARPARPLEFWPDRPSVLAGRDIQAGGTWLGVAANLRFASVTNLYSPVIREGELSRGTLCVDWLTGSERAESFAQNLVSERYAPFNLLFGFLPDRLYHLCGRSGLLTSLPDGYHGISNGALNNDWPKVEQGKHALARAIAHGAQIEDLFAVLRDRTPAPDEFLPNTGLERSLESRLSARFILGADYGTRASTIVLASADGSAEVFERRFAADGSVIGETQIKFPD